MGKTLPKILTPQQVSAILDYPNPRSKTGCRNRAIYQMMYRAGLRVSEVCELRTGDVDLGEEKPEIHIINGKGGKDRNMPIPKLLEPFVREWAAKRNPRKEFFFHPISYCGGDRMSRRNIYDTIKLIARKRGLPKWTSPHSLRHAFATNCLRGHMNLREIQILLGHSSISTTQIYLHCDTDELRKSLDRAWG